MKQKHKFFASELAAELSSGEDLDTRIAKAIRSMVIQASSDPREIEQSVRVDTARELTRNLASGILDYLATEGIDIRHARMMDLGAGLGMVSEEAAIRGANPVAVEPGRGYREIALERIRRAGRGMVVAARGENLPFRDNSFDVVISLEVLEHVEDPATMLREVRRILRPGGWLYLACPNYLGFREPHYDVAWLPLLPKPLGVLYLRLRGRPTEFLKTSITYTTLPWVRRQLRKLGLRSVREREIFAFCRSPSSIRNRWKRAVVMTVRQVLPAEMVARLIARLDQTANLCTPHISELVQKPHIDTAPTAHASATSQEYIAQRAQSSPRR